MVTYDDTTGESAEYAAFVDKFKPKKTTDDCYTPANVYAAVLGWAVEEYGLQGRPVVRPFYPGGDYERHEYPAGCVVIDNPPFSILSRICRWYAARNIDFFLFAPSLTLFAIGRGAFNYVVPNTNVTYTNGAVVRTGFVTNLGEYKVCTAFDLRARVKAADDENKHAGISPQERHIYPDNVITSATVQKYANSSVPLRLRADDVVFTSRLDAQRAAGGGLYGGGFILTDAAAEHLRQVADAPRLQDAPSITGGLHVWELSQAELDSVGSKRKTADWLT